MSRKGRGGRLNKGGTRNAPRALEEPLVPASKPDGAEAFAAGMPGAPGPEEPLGPMAEALMDSSVETPVAARVAPDAELPQQQAAEQEEEGQGEPEGAPPADPALDADDSSYPPVDFDAHFFDGQGLLRGSEPPFDMDERDPRMALKRTPEVARRRAELQKYVKLAVGAASALCLAALVKVAVTRNPSDDGARGPTEQAAAVETARTTVPAPTVPTTPPATVAPSSPATVAPSSPATVAPSSPAMVAPLSSPELAAAVAPLGAPSSDPAVPTPAATPAEPDPKAAAKEKNDCRAALERGKVADAIEAGERSVALDPTDGEAWLILGRGLPGKGRHEERAPHPTRPAWSRANAARSTSARPCLTSATAGLPSGGARAPLPPCVDTL